MGEVLKPCMAENVGCGCGQTSDCPRFHSASDLIGTVFVLENFHQTFSLNPPHHGLKRIFMIRGTRPPDTSHDWQQLLAGWITEFSPTRNNEWLNGGRENGVLSSEKEEAATASIATRLQKLQVHGYLVAGDLGVSTGDVTCWG